MPNQVHTCKSCAREGRPHPYTVCVCGHQYCSREYKQCPRSHWEDHPKSKAESDPYYASRAQAAYALAEASSDPRDKAAFQAAAKTWEQLAKPATGTTYSMEPHRMQLAALKRDAIDALVEAEPPVKDVPMPWCDACGGYHHPTAPGCFKVTRPLTNKPVIIEF